MSAPAADQKTVPEGGEVRPLSHLRDHAMLVVACGTAALALVLSPAPSASGSALLSLWLPALVAILVGAYADILKRRRRSDRGDAVRTLADRDATIALLEKAARAASDTERELEIMVAGHVQDLARARRTAEAETFERRRAEEMLRRVAHQDALTGLPNRALLRDRFVVAASIARRNGSRTSVLVVNLDGFQKINVTHGTAVGDAALVMTAGLLRDRLRDVDTVARVSGDEFVVLVCDLPTAHEARHIAERILAFIAAPMQIGESLSLDLTASIGIAMLGTDGDDIDTLLKSAGTALRRAKEAGRNTWRYHTSPVDTVVPSIAAILRTRRDAATPSP